MDKLRIFGVNEGNSFSHLLSEEVFRRGFSLEWKSTDEVLSAVNRGDPAVLFFNFSATPPVQQTQLIQEVRALDEHLPIFIFAPLADVATAVSFMKAGVTDFRIWPLDFDDLEIQLRRASEIYQLTQRVYQLEHRAGSQGDFFGIVGQSPKMQENFKTIGKVAKTHATVLIQGPSGTGKELVAKAIHLLSGRAKNKFVDLNCGAIPHELLENELFGHERGAYTGAERRYIGSFERAEGGTLFLDEIGEMDPSLQVKILRVLQERNFTRVGGSERVEVDVRVITATNRDLQKEVESGRFREDLYYRLNVVPIILPPLRERREDIPLLARHFLNIYSIKNEKIFFDFHPEAMAALMAYSWPGNVRELENTIERVVVLANDSQVKLKHLPESIRSLKKAPGFEVQAEWVRASGGNGVVPLEEVERYAIENALRQCDGNVLEAARKLQIGQATLYRKIRKFGIAREAM